MKTRLKLRFLFASAGILIVLAYSGTGAYLWTKQAHFIFRPERNIYSTPADHGIPYEDLYIAVDDRTGKQEQIHAWFMPAANSRLEPAANSRLEPADRATGKYLLYLHGSALNIGANINHAQRFRDMGLSVLLVSYRGYGKSDGVFPEESKMYADAEAAWNYLVVQKQADPQYIYIYGHSLGGAVAINLAYDHPYAGGLVVESTFTSIVDMARLKPAYRIFPLNLIVHQRFDSLKKVRELKVPVIFFHGTRDSLVPYSMTEKLYQFTASAKKIKLIHGGGHNNSALVGGLEYLEALKDFFKFTARV